MHDLNNLFYFAKIVEHGSLSAAGQALGISKSVLSQHLARLEADLGVRLIQRTTRRLRVTDLGMRYYERCRAVLAEAARADDVIDDARGEPHGVVRLTSPVNFAQCILARLLADFMCAYPNVEVRLDITNREVDLIAEGYDLALRIAPEIRTSSLVARSFRLDRHVLVAGRPLLERFSMPRDPAGLHGWPSLGGLHGSGRGSRHTWTLVDADGTGRTVVHRPRLLTEDLFVLKQAALDGCGITELPRICCRDELADGSLVQVLPGWQLPEMHLHAVFASRAGLSSALRCFIDYLARHLEGVLDSAIEGTLRMSLVPRESPPEAVSRLS